jgi:8-oxo-dGTP pyrophosphatase MutT (NUDIX family)
MCPLTSEPDARQVIVRPPLHRLGGPPPWRDLSTDARRSITLERVTRAVQGRSGLSAPRNDEIAVARAFGDPGAASDPAAVLVALFEEDGDVRVVLTVRAGHLRSHRNEVAFPGGRLDPGEEIDQGALREAYEEVRLDPALVTVIGHLAPMPTVSSNTVMTPVVAVLPGRPSLEPEPSEVDRIFDVALSDLLAEGVFAEELWSVPGRPGPLGVIGAEFPVWFFETAGEIIWGATARVLVELLTLTLGTTGPPAR